MNIPLQKLIKTKRADFYSIGQRSKYIGVPRKIIEAGNHFVWEAFEGDSVHVKPEEAYLHHYRFVGAPAQNWTLDQTVHKYRRVICSNDVDP